jgi:hypothetical protein
VKTKLSILSIILVIFGALYSVPYFINWDTKVKKISEYILENYGLEVDVAGSVTVKSFPMLKIIVQGISVSSHYGEDKVTIFKAGMATANFKLIELLKGNIVLSNLTFDDGTIDLDSRINSGVFSKISSNYGEHSIGAVNEFNLNSFVLKINGEQIKKEIDGISINIKLGQKLQNILISGSYVHDSDKVNIYFNADKDLLSFKLFKDNGFAFDYKGSFNNDLSNVVSAGKLSILLTKISDGTILVDNPIPFVSFLSSDLMNNSNVSINGDLEIANGDLNAKQLKIVSPLLNGTADYSFTTSTEKILSKMSLKLTDLDLVGVKFGDRKSSTDHHDDSNDLIVSRYVGNKFFDLSAVSKSDSDIDVSIDTIKYTGGTIKNMVLDASIKNGAFKLNNLNLDLAGGIEFSLSDVYSRFVEDENVLVGNVVFSTKNLGDQFALTNLPNYLQVKDNTNCTFSSKVILAEKEITLYGIDALVNQGQITGRWTVQTHNPERNKFDIDLTFSNFNIDDFKAKRFSEVVGGLFNNSNQKNYYANFVQLRELDSNALVKLRFTNSNLGTVVIDNFYTELHINPAKLHFKNSQIVSPFANVKGDIIINSTALRPNIDVNLSGELIDSDMANKVLFGVELDKNNASLPQSNGLDMKDVNIQSSANVNPVNDKKTISDVTQSTAAAAQPNADKNVVQTAADTNTKPYWSRNNFQYFRIDKFDGNLNLALNKFVYQGVEIDNLLLESRMKENVWFLDYVKGNIFGGDLLAKGNVQRSDAQVTVSISAALNNFVMQSVTVGGDSLKGITGKASVSGSFYMVGQSPFDFMNSMNSTMSFAIRGLSIEGLDIDRIILISAKIPTDVDKYDVLDQVDRAYKSGETNFKSVDGQLVVKKGVLQTNNVTFSTANSNGYLSSSVDVRYLLTNSLVEFIFKPTVSKILSLRLQVLGPYNKLVKAVDDKELIDYIRMVYGIELPKVAAPKKQVATEFIYQKIIE